MGSPMRPASRKTRMSVSGEKGRLRRPSSEDGVRRDGGAVDQQFAAGQERAYLDTAIRGGEVEGGQHPHHRVFRRRGCLVHMETSVVLDEEVGKGSAGIDRESHRHELGFL